MDRSLEDWLNWQQGLHPREIELGLSRVSSVLTRLELSPPPHRVFTIAGTNGKGTTAHYLAALMDAAGCRTGVYTSPHLVRYNERIRVAGKLATDQELVTAFEAVETARQTDALTYFEFGTLAALWLFDRAELDAWVLEVGLGGRLDAVNALDADFSLITSVDLDHQDWLGDSIELIAAEKAGILRPGRPALYGARQLPEAIIRRAADIQADLRVAGRDFGYERAADAWSWWCKPATERRELPIPAPGDNPLLANISLALAAAATCAPGLVEERQIRLALAGEPPAGRSQQLLHLDRHWLLDVAHNPQAARALARRLENVAPHETMTIVLGLHGNKDVDNIVRSLAPFARRWICCRAGQYAGAEPAGLASRISKLVAGVVDWRDSPADALQLAVDQSQSGQWVVVCGSFEVVGPALVWLGADELS